MDLLREAGSYAGLAAFLGLAVLILLYFAQARDVRRLRENARFLVDGNEVPADASPEEAAAAVAAREPEEAAAAAAASAPNDREAFRRAELARQAAERRKRFEQRRQGPSRPSLAGSGNGGRPSWLRETPSIVVIAVGALLLLAGIGFGATRLLGDEETTPKTKSGAAAVGQTKVAVLNSTAQGGLAAEFAGLLKPGGYQTGPVTNTETPYDTSVVMFDQMDPNAQQAAQQVAADVGIQDIQPMSTEIRSISEGATVAVILGEDQAGGASSSGTTTDTSGI